MKQTSQSPKKKSVNPIPEGYHTVTPFLVVTQADLLLDFIKKAFNGEVTSRMLDDQGRVMHATAKIGDSIVMRWKNSLQCKPCYISTWMMLMPPTTRR